MKSRIWVWGLLLTLLLGLIGAGAESLEIPVGTREIKAEAFKNCTSLTGVLSIPEAVTTIGPSAFEGCVGFSGLPVIPPSVTSIGARAFALCTGLSGTLYVPETVDMDDTAFAGCPNLTVVRRPLMRVALIADGSLSDGAMLQECHEAAKSFCKAEGLDYITVEDGDGAVDEAVAQGSNVILMPGFTYAQALAEGAASHPEVKFVGIDFEPDALPENAFTATYREEQAGFMAGYAAVKLGYRHLGFLGGMEIPSVTAYGNGFAQGMDAAAVELGVADDVLLEYGYAGTFAPNPEITEHMREWYKTLGVEVVFACGGGIWGSVGGAIAETGMGKLIGVDTDQAATIDGLFGPGTTVTSAMKDVGVTVRMALQAIADGEWDRLGGATLRLGVESADPAGNHVGLPDSTQFGKGFTRSDYAALVARLYAGDYAPSAGLPGLSIGLREHGVL